MSTRVWTGVLRFLSTFNVTLLTSFQRIFARNPRRNSVVGLRPPYVALGWIALIAPIGLVLALSFGMHRMSAGTAQALFWIYAALNGVGFSILFAAFTAESIFRVFFICAAMFAAMSLWGYTTKRDLTGFGSFLFMGLIGLLIASVVNMFLWSSGLQFVLSIVGVLIFTGLTAYDTQNIKNTYLQMRSGGGEAYMGKAAIMGALQLYLDFINMFMFLLQLFGQRE